MRRVVRIDFAACGLFDCLVVMRLLWDTMGCLLYCIKGLDYNYWGMINIDY